MKPIPPITTGVLIAYAWTCWGIGIITGWILRGLAKPPKETK